MVIRRRLTHHSIHDLDMGFQAQCSTGDSMRRGAERSTPPAGRGVARLHGPTLGGEPKGWGLQGVRGGRDFANCPLALRFLDSRW